MTKYTDWFPPEIKPVHVGVYEIDAEDDDGRAFAYWDGAYFGLTCWERLSRGGAIRAAMRKRGQCVAYTAAGFSCWRGLSEKPKGE